MRSVKLSNTLQTLLVVVTPSSDIVLFYTGSMFIQ